MLENTDHDTIKSTGTVNKCQEKCWRYKAERIFDGLLHESDKAVPNHWSVLNT